MNDPCVVESVPRGSRSKNNWKVQASKRQHILLTLENGERLKLESLRFLLVVIVAK